jgi:peptide subunit release factor RF-3
MKGSPSACSTRRATRISAHWNFSEDTYRTLTAVPPPFPPPLAGEGQGGGHSTPPPMAPRKLFEVCRLRDVPIITFVNKLDSEGRDPFDLLDEIEQSSALDVTLASWPIGMERDFLGTTTCSPMRCCCSSAASTTGSRSRSAAMASTTRNCCRCWRKPPSPSCARSLPAEVDEFDEDSLRNSSIRSV